MAFEARVVVLVLCGVAAAAALGVQVNTVYGPVVGSASPLGLSWKGIPFATPPVGPLRWKQSTPHAPWTEPLATQQYSAGCPQNWCVPVCFKDVWCHRSLSSYSCAAAISRLVSIDCL